VVARIGDVAEDVRELPLGPGPPGPRELEYFRVRATRARKKNERLPWAEISFLLL
jgi:hypothetical protein